jgi:hypothetical protein
MSLQKRRLVAEAVIALDVKTFDPEKLIRKNYHEINVGTIASVLSKFETAGWLTSNREGRKVLQYTIIGTEDELRFGKINWHKKQDEAKAAAEQEATEEVPLDFSIDFVATITHTDPTSREVSAFKKQIANLEAMGFTVDVA